mmetsp:Transcript_2283/g.4907  ORF Transcript_2283/g.4907 Transcript_2283/m.4907 type:complete len:211 (+) Transcript_2283:445-1077(+)
MTVVNNWDPPTNKSRKWATPAKPYRIPMSFRNESSGLASIAAGNNTFSASQLSTTSAGVANTANGDSGVYSMVSVTTPASLPTPAASDSTSNSKSMTQLVAMPWTPSGDTTVNLPGSFLVQVQSTLNWFNAKYSSTISPTRSVCVSNEGADVEIVDTKAGSFFSVLLLLVVRKSDASDDDKGVFVWRTSPSFCSFLITSTRFELNTISGQ